MTSRTVAVELIHIGDQPAPDWDYGPMHEVPSTPSAVAAALERCTSDAILCVDQQLPVPSIELVRTLLQGPADAWHGGLCLGLSAYHRMQTHVNPQWMLTVPVDPDCEVTSPLLSLQALLVRRTVVQQLGGPDDAMETLTGAGLELGVRWIRAGAIVRHVPGLVTTERGASSLRLPPPSVRDEVLSVTRHHGRTWAMWALTRSILQREVPLTSGPRLVRTLRRADTTQPPFYRVPFVPSGEVDRTVSVVLPTVDRYSYLEPLLHQLAAQTHTPVQVLIVDQTPKDRRRNDLDRIEPGLPVTVMTLEVSGQSTARNLALERAKGELVLFIDDDDELGETLIEDHLRRLGRGIDAVCGGVDDATAGPPLPGFRHRRASDALPTNNSMVHMAALRRAGFFDPAFDHGPRADRDLGIRLHLTGALMVYDPEVMVFHHHAPVGGLRIHGVRATTRASSRRSLTSRNLPTATEYYIGLRYFNEQQRREDQAVRLLSTFSASGSSARRLLRFGTQVFLLPSTLRKMAASRDLARRLLAASHRIPPLVPQPSVAAAPAIYQCAARRSAADVEPPVDSERVEADSTNSGAGS